jgi:hypothetical protein
MHVGRIMSKASIAILLTVILTTAFALSAAIAANEENSTVKGEIFMQSGKWVFADVYFVTHGQNKLFSYWWGKNGGISYIYDPLRMGWMPAPLDYYSIFIKFRGRRMKCFVRTWGSRETQSGYYDPSSKRYITTHYTTYLFEDNWYLFGFDGMVYKLVKTDDQGNPVKKPYYLNMTTGEQSIWGPRTAEEQAKYDAMKESLTVDGMPTFTEWQASPGKLPPSFVPWPESEKGEENPQDTPPSEGEGERDGESAG